MLRSGTLRQPTLEHDCIIAAFWFATRVCSLNKQTDSWRKCPVMHILEAAHWDCANLLWKLRIINRISSKSGILQKTSTQERFLNEKGRQTCYLGLFFWHQVLIPVSEGRKKKFHCSYKSSYTLNLLLISLYESLRLDFHVTVYIFPPVRHPRTLKVRRLPLIFEQWRYCEEHAGTRVCSYTIMKMTSSPLTSVWDSSSF